MRPILLSFVRFDQPFYLSPFGRTEKAPLFLRCICWKRRVPIPAEHSGEYFVEVHHEGEFHSSTHYFHPDTIVYL